ncbi:hypothetical protein AQI88_23835 [Streptomyces cellostaticus]|uniref:Uncharacterized protein n=1 Tax=Streptomyces cellostaticus TaxID=67285 RepID=A0A101NJA0_9ACTN|nr:hypothetical protein [Streptomyces cellostaticus]KUM94019.1 hypothetical protein AQI88_23835 [Streptomyces cellostaticus]GHI05055.1 hypothetical protein Scel_33760 [Streptomyces cellostaticus]
MTERHQPRALRWALRCHPAAYRAEHEAELTAIYAEATEDAGSLGRLREALDIAGHGLRQRTGLGSGRTAGQILAQAAPLTVAVAAGSGVASLLWLFTPGIRTLPSSSLPGVLLLADQGLVPLIWLAALAAVWTGRWTVARTLVVPATLLRLADLPLLLLAHFDFHGIYTGAVLNLTVPLLTGALVLAAPKDLLGTSQPQRAAMTGTAALAVLLWGAQLLGDIYHAPALGGPRTTHTLWAGVLAITLLFTRRHRLPAAGLAVAVLPAALQTTVPLLHPLSPAGAGALLVVLLSGAVPFLRARATPPSAA